jgi:hypothetical protein
VTVLSKKTVKLLTARAGIASREIPVEAQKILELHEDPNVSPATKELAMRAIDEKIKDIEEKQTTRRVREQQDP